MRHWKANTIHHFGARRQCWPRGAACTGSWLAAPALLAGCSPGPDRGPQAPEARLESRTAPAIAASPPPRAEGSQTRDDARAQPRIERLTDAQRGTLGELVHRADGVVDLKDSQGRWLGRYDPRQNRTTDSRSKTVGYGNLLPTLLCDRERESSQSTRIVAP